MAAPAARSLRGARCAPRTPAQAPVRRCAAPRRAAARAMGAGKACAPLGSDEEKASLIDSTKVFVFDCDGVIWKGDSVIDGVPEALAYLRSKGKRLFFVTNNSTKSRAGYLKKFTTLGLDVQAEEIFSSSFAAAGYLKQQGFPEDKKVYIIGEVGIVEELDLAGIKHVGGPEDAGKKVELKPGEMLVQDPDVAAVVVGFDREINYHKIQMATLCIRENKAEFIGTNPDAVTHLTAEQEWAGNGSMVGAIKGSTNQEPTIVGKPSQFMLDYMAKEYGISKSEICMVGDRLDTDIEFGNAGGAKTLLVLSGVTTEGTLLSPDNSIKPDFYASSMPELTKLA